MRITVLGSGAAYPRPGGSCAGFLVEGAGVRVWLDAGNGTFSRLTQLMPYRDVDALVLSHSHADHIADVLPLMYALAFDEEADGPLAVHAPPDVPEKLAHPLGEGSIDAFRTVFRFHSLHDPFEVGGLRFEPFRTVHPPETYGVRVTDGDKLFVYTADTADFPELPDECRDADLLLCEATFARGAVAPPGIHLWSYEAGTVAQKAHAARLVVTHVWPTCPLETVVAEAAETFGGPTEAAREGAVYEL